MQEQLQGYWDFVLILGPGIRDRASVDWSKMLPASDVTGWLSLDFKNKLMTIEPLAAYPDRQPIEGRERANARMAIANALYQGARRKLLPKA